MIDGPRGGHYRSSRPAGAAARLQVSGGASKLRFDDQHLGSVGGETRLETPNYRGAADRYDISFTGGVSRLTVDSY